VYVKFQGISESELGLRWNTLWLFLRPNWIEMLKRGAFLQWEENKAISRYMNIPRKILPKMIRSTEHQYRGHLGFEAQYTEYFGFEIQYTE